MSDNTLIKAQDNILLMLMEGPKGRDDFWSNSKFKKKETDERGIYPRKMLHIMKDADLVEKYKVKNRVHWKIVENAFFRMDGKEYTWNYENPEIKVIKPIDMYVEVGKIGNEIYEVSVVDKPIDPECVIKEEPKFFNNKNHLKPIKYDEDKLPEVVDAIEEVEEDEFPYLDKVKEALEKEPKKSWLKKLKLW